MVVPQGAEVKLYWIVGGEVAINVLGARVIGNPVFNQAMADSLGSGIKAVLASSGLAAMLATSTSLTRVGVRDLRTSNQPEFRDTGAAAAGTGTGDVLPGSVALCITKRTAGAGKSFRGRYYQSGFTETENTAAGVASSAAVGNTLAFLQQITTPFSSASLFPAVLTMEQEEVIITKVTNHVGPPPSTETKILSHQTAKPGAAHDITTYVSRDTNWESQRRRTNRRGLTAPSLAIPNGVNVEP